jgi:biopolymer transport protein ExbD
MHFRREQEENYSLELTPLIDVVFLLLIFFMVSTAFVDFPRRMDINLPTSKAASDDEVVKNLEIEMTKDKKIFILGRRTNLQQLEVSLAELKKPQEVKTIIRADKDIPYGDVVKVMGLLQAAKVICSLTGLERFLTAHSILRACEWLPIFCWNTSFSGRRARRYFEPFLPPASCSAKRRSTSVAMPVYRLSPLTRIMYRYQSAM